MNQGGYQKRNQRRVTSGQGRYGENNSSVEPRLWICPNCETINTGYACLLCGYQYKTMPLDNTNKKKNKRWIVVLTTLVLLAGVGLWFGNHYQTKEKYEKACSYLEQQRYSEACELFTGLKEYRDSREKLLQAKYEWAISELDLSNFAEAQNLFSNLGNYLDSEQQAIYAGVLQLEKENKFSDAIEEMEQIPGHPHFKQVLNRLNYAYAKQFWQNKAYSHAYRILFDLGDYRDARELLPDLILKWADYLNRGSLDKSMFFNTVRLDEVWDDPLIQHTVASAPFDWLRGSWKSDDGDYLIVPQDLGSIQYSFMIERDINRYYGYGYSTDANSCIGEFFWHVSAYNEVLKVFRFEPTGPDTVEIYCYADRKTYTMYRYRQ